jgi:hypothetical protein
MFFAKTHGAQEAGHAARRRVTACSATAIVSALAVLTSARTIPATPCKCFVHDTSNGARATAALGAAAKAAVNLPRRPGHPVSGKRCPHVIVA